MNISDLVSKSLVGKTIELYEYKKMYQEEPRFTYALSIPSYPLGNPVKVDKVITDVEITNYECEPPSIYIMFKGGSICVELDYDLPIKNI